MTTEDIESAVNMIEFDILESTGGVEYFNISLSTNGFVQRVDFVGITLWDSEADERLYEDETDESTREPIEDHLRRRLREEITKLNMVVV